MFTDSGIRNSDQKKKGHLASITYYLEALTGKTWMLGVSWWLGTRIIWRFNSLEILYFRSHDMTTRLAIQSTTRWPPQVSWAVSQHGGLGTIGLLICQLKVLALRVLVTKMEERWIAFYNLATEVTEYNCCPIPLDKGIKSLPKQKKYRLPPLNGISAKNFVLVF